MAITSIGNSDAFFSEAARLFIKDTIGADPLLSNNRHDQALKWLVLEGDQLIGAVYWAPPNPLYMTGPKGMIPKVFDRLKLENWHLHRVRVNDELAVAVRRHVQQSIRVARTATLLTHDCATSYPLHAPLRCALPEDRAFLSEWMYGLCTEMRALVSPHEAKEMVAQYVVDQRLFIYGDDAPVSMAMISPTNALLRTIHHVYTPPLLRKKGYGKQCVAALAAFLETPCSIYAEGDGPRSVYKQAGFVERGEMVELVFT
ncbi:N-acetyltransferase GCN5 [Fictibacillus macauensis ZFHKF-1]|uniref:N-acetyltransferase GCN5 n=1 Tax=Fictibacillus macauensis ZFHKF-1 TaxID=1196324 RepID=I8ADM7_9BACL|nr:N-acetyltransferase [Fictibacillus macauensis]EIT83657.1 N-acetyltransferase GCN5 [Fictibacillus macauensis ZFHKF-1]